MDFLFALWFFAPAGLANIAPVLTNNIPKLKDFNYPLDGGKTYRGKRIFGDHKTVRGLLSGMFVGFLTGLVQMTLYSHSSFVRELSLPLDYSNPKYLIMGASMGLGALFGDAIKSFFKRQINIQPGSNWVPFDQIDFILGGILFSLPFAQLSLKTYMLIIVLMTLLHPLINLLGWILHLKNKPF